MEFEVLSEVLEGPTKRLASRGLLNLDKQDLDVSIGPHPCSQKRSAGLLNTLKWDIN